MKRPVDKPASALGTQLSGEAARSSMCSAIGSRQGRIRESSFPASGWARITDSLGSLLDSVNTSAFSVINPSESPKLKLDERFALVSPIENRRASVRESDYTSKWIRFRAGNGSNNLICKHSGAYRGERLQICDIPARLLQSRQVWLDRPIRGLSLVTVSLRCRGSKLMAGTRPSATG